MNRLEASFTNPSHRRRVSGLDLQVIDIAESAALQRSIHDFMLVAVDPLEYVADGHTFNHRRISALGSRGTLLSVYMQQSPHATRAVEYSHVALTANVSDPIVEAWSTTLTPQEYGSQTTELVIGEQDNPDIFTALDLGMSPDELDEQRFQDQLADARDWQELPRIRFGNGPWHYEQNGAIETLTDLRWIEGRVRLAIARNFGKAVFRRFDPEMYLSPNTGADTGQVEQKVVA
jgi:hypothetical protein